MAAAYFLSDVVKNAESFKGAEPIVALLLHDHMDFKVAPSAKHKSSAQADLFPSLPPQLQALQSLRTVASYLVSGVEAQGSRLTPENLLKAQELFLKTPAFAENLGALYGKLWEQDKTPEALSSLNDVLLCLNLLAEKEYDVLGGVISGEKGLSQILASLGVKELQERASTFLDIVSKHEDGLHRVFEKRGAEAIAENLVSMVSLGSCVDI
jgi:hypothetical protein